jgi:hypothetical protein
MVASLQWAQVTTSHKMHKPKLKWMKCTTIHYSPIPAEGVYIKYLGGSRIKYHIRVANIFSHAAR